MITLSTIINEQAQEMKLSVLDFGRPSISGSIRSIKMYSWA
jgi:hypothetical protein